MFFNTGVKSHPMTILEASQILPNSVPTVPSLVIDGPSLVNSKQQNNVKPLITMPMTLS